jgi:hypothetical protein
MAMERRGELKLTAPVLLSEELRLSIDGARLS